MKSMISNSTRSGSGEMTPFSRNSEFNHLMNYFWNYFDTTGNAGESSALAEIEPHLQIVLISDIESATSNSLRLPGKR